MIGTQMNADFQDSVQQKWFRRLSARISVLLNQKSVGAVREPPLHPLGRADIAFLPTCLHA